MTKRANALFLFLSVALCFGVAPLAMAQPCADLTASQCATSPICMLEADKTCRPARDRCDIGFRQEILRQDGSALPNGVDTRSVSRATCETRAFCQYVPAGDCYCPPISNLTCYCGGGAPPGCIVKDNARAPDLHGSYVFADLRHRTGGPEPGQEQRRQAPKDARLTFSDGGLELPGTTCDDWTRQAIQPRLDLLNPALADVLIGPVNPFFSGGDNRRLSGWRFTCEGVDHFDFVDVDGRVLIFLGEEGRPHMVFRKPLEQVEILRLQGVLAFLGYLRAGPTGHLDRETRDGVKMLIEKRLGTPLAPSISRQVIAANLLDGFGKFPKMGK